MDTASEVIVQDPKFTAESQFFRGTRSFQTLLDYLEGERRWMNSWNNTRSFPENAIGRWKRRRPCLAPSGNENPD